MDECCCYHYTGKRDACSLSTTPRPPVLGYHHHQCPESRVRPSACLTSAEYSATDQLVGGGHGGDTWVRIQWRHVG